MYRPEGFENPYNFMTGEAIPKWEGQSSAYEAGADAMLVGLKHNSEYIDAYTQRELCRKYGVENGCLVFIPEDTE